MRAAAVIALVLGGIASSAYPLPAQEFIATDGDTSHLIGGSAAGQPATAGRPAGPPASHSAAMGNQFPAQPVSAAAAFPAAGQQMMPPFAEDGGDFQMLPAEGCPEGFMDAGDPTDGCAACMGTPGTEVPQTCRDLWDQMNSCRKLWFRAEYLDWSVRGDILPPLLTTSPPGTPQGIAGVLGNDTQVLFPSGRVNQGSRPGMRFQGGWWFDQGETNGLQADYFILDQQTTNFAIHSPNTPILARPFYNVDAGIQDASYLAFPNYQVLETTANLAGSFIATESSRAQSASLLWKRLLWVNCNRFYWYRLNGTIGYRFFQLAENLRIIDQVTPTGGPFADGTQIDSFDNFNTATRFNGLDIGLTGDVHRGRFSAELWGRVAFGDSHHVTKISGMRRSFDSVSTVVTEGGLLAQPTNIGRWAGDDFGILPEGSVTLGMQITGGLRATIGYSFIYLSQVQRPGTAIDFAVNPTQIGGSPLSGDPRPGYVHNTTDVWLQGLTVGLDFRY